MSAFFAAIGAIFTGPMAFVVLMLAVVVVINFVLITRVSAAWDKACADLIKAKTDELVEKHRTGQDTV